MKITLSTLLILLTVNSTAAQNRQSVRLAFGGPNRESYALRPGIELRVTYLYDGDLKSFFISRDTEWRMGKRSEDPKTDSLTEDEAWQIVSRILPDVSTRVLIHDPQHYEEFAWRAYRVGDFTVVFQYENGFLACAFCLARGESYYLDKPPN